MVEMTDTLFCHPRVGGDLPLVMSINSTTHHEDLRLIASIRFAAFPVVKLQQSSEVYCHTESDTNLHGNDKPRIQTSYLLPLVEGQASAVQRVPIVGTSRGGEARARGSCISKIPHSNQLEYSTICHRTDNNTRVKASILMKRTKYETLEESFLYASLPINSQRSFPSICNTGDSCMFWVFIPT